MHQISNTVNRKFVDSLEVSDWEIESDTGWVDVNHINVTIPYEVYQLTTTAGVLYCADNHIVFTEDHDEIFVKNLKSGDAIIGQYGLEYVSSVFKTDRVENMYDLSVSGSHTYYAENLLHHNTTTTAAYFVWYIIFNDNKQVAVLANKQATADEVMYKICMAYENLPHWLQQGVRSWNKRSIELENGSRVFGSATSASAIRGKAINIIMIDEMAHIDNTLAEEFFTAVYPTIAAGKDSKIFITSTPNGFNHFHRIWNEAEKGLNGFKAFRVHWYQTPGRDQKWFDEQRAVLGELKTAQEILGSFMGSSRQLLNAQSLSKLTYDLPLKEYVDQFKGLKLYKMPEKHKVYSMSVDVSRGRHLDYSAFTIFDITQYPHTIVATYRNNEISPMLYATILQKIGINYNNSYMLIEINDIGGQVADILWNECEYENLHWTKSGELLGKAGSDPYPGIRTTRKTKRIGCANLKDMVENDQLIINDFDMISELSTFVQKDGGSYEADTGFHDDTVATLWLHAWMITQPWFSELTDTNLRLKMHSNHIAQMESEICMPILYTDGLEEYDDYSLRYEWSNGY